MRPKALAFLLSSIACLFIVVWGGGYWWITHSRDQAKREQIAKEQAETNERQAAEDRRIADERAAKEKADSEKAVAEANAVKQKQADVRKAAIAKATAEQFNKRIELLTRDERRVYELAAKLKTERIKETRIHLRPGGMMFLFTERDGLFAGLPVIERLAEYADDIGVGEFIDEQNLKGDDAGRARLAYALMDGRDHAIAKIVLKSIKEKGIQGVGDQGKLFIRTHLDLFPKYAP